MPTRSSQALAVAAASMLLAAFVSTATNIAVPILETEFPDAGLATVSWVVSGFNVAQVTFMLLGGRMADRIGRRRVFLAGLVVFGVGATLSGIAPIVELVIVARVIQAIGVALMIPSSLAAVLPQYPPEKHGTVVSLWSSMGVLGAAIAPAVAAGLLYVSNWRLVFLAPLPIVALAAVVGRRVLAEGAPRETPPRLDLVGAASGTAAVGGLTIAIVQGRAWGWTDPKMMAIVLLGVGGIGVFVWSSKRHPEPLVDFALLKIPTFTVVAGAGALVAASTSATWFLYPLFMVEVWDYSVLEVGMAMTPGPIAVVLVAPFVGRAADRWGFRWFLILGSTMATVGTAWMAWQLKPDGVYVTAFLPGTLSIGLGMACMLGPANAAALRDIVETQLAEANAAYNTLKMTGMAVGVAVSAAIIGDAAVGDRLSEFTRAWVAMTAIMAFAPLILLVGYHQDRHISGTGPNGRQSQLLASGGSSDQIV